MRKIGIFRGLPLLVIVLLVACHNQAGAPASRAEINISPESSALSVGQTEEFTAVLTDLPDDSLSWSTTGGTITGSGLTVEYTAPTTPGNYVITVAASPSGLSASAEITVTSSGPAVWVSPESSALSVGQTEEFTAVLTDLPDDSLSWSTTGGTITGSGLTVEYTAPTTPGNYVITALAEPSGLSASADVVVDSPFTFHINDPGENRDYSNDLGVKFVEQGGRPGFLTLDILSTTPDVDTSVLVTIESSPPSGVEFSWTEYTAKLCPGCDDKTAIPLDISADSSAPLGSHEITFKAVAGDAVLTSDAIFVVEEAPTEVGGVIDADTVWTLEGSPYRIVSPVQVDVDATLTIDSGVIVSDGSIQVWGELEALGRSDSPIVLRDMEIRGSPSSSSYGPYEMHFQNVEFFKVDFQPVGGGSDAGVFSLRDSTIHSGFADVRVWHPTGEVFVERNVFHNSVRFHGSHRQSMYFTENTFHAEGGIQSTYSAGPPIVLRDNNFLSPDFKVSLGDTGGGNADARYNYWGTTDASVIQNMIVDRNNGLEYRNEIPFEPFLSAPVE